MAISQNSNPRSKLRRIPEFCPYGHGIASIFLLPMTKRFVLCLRKIRDFSTHSPSKLEGILVKGIKE
jgi:hypothetical protein